MNHLDIQKCSLTGHLLLGAEYLVFSWNYRSLQGARYLPPFQILLKRNFWIQDWTAQRTVLYICSGREDFFSSLCGSLVLFHWLSRTLMKTTSPVGWGARSPQPTSDPHASVPLCSSFLNNKIPSSPHLPVCRGLEEAHRAVCKRRSV